MTSVYLFCLTLGFVFTVGSALLGGLLGGADGGADGGVDLDVGDVDVDVGEGDAGLAGHGSISLPIFSPMVLSFFIASLGGSGLLYQELFGPTVWLHLPPALVTAAAMGTGMAWAILKITTAFEKHRMARGGDALGAVVEVSVSVPAEGVGEVTYVSGGTRQALSARSSDGRPHPQGAPVRVLRVSDGVAFVAEASALAPVAEMSVQGQGQGQPVHGRSVGTRARR